MFHPDKKVIQCVDGELSLGLICACFNCTNCKSTSLKDDDNRAPLELAIEGEHDECARTLAPCCLCASLAHEDTYGWSCPTCRARLCGVCRAQMHKARESNRTLRARQPNSCSSPGVRAPLHAAALRGQHPDASEGLLHTRASARPDSH